MTKTATSTSTRSAKTRAAREAKKAAEAHAAFRRRVENLGGEVVRYDAPCDWLDSLIDDAELTPDQSDREITDAAESWAQDHGCYADPDGEDA